MKQRDLIKKLEAAGFVFKEHGGNHDTYKLRCKIYIKEVTNYKQSRDFWKFFDYVKMCNLNRPSENIVFQMEQGIL